MFEKFHCDHCRRLLLTVEPGRLTTHGAMSIRTRSADGWAWVECPQCGKESPVELELAALQLS